MPDDDLAGAILHELGEGDRRLCTRCLMGPLGIDLWGLLKGVRALIGTGRILCTVGPCSRCARSELVIARRRPAFERPIRAIDNPLDADGDPICPVCFHAIPVGDSVLRADNLVVHFECDDRTLGWRPGHRPSSTSE